MSAVENFIRHKPLIGFLAMFAITLIFVVTGNVVVVTKAVQFQIAKQIEHKAGKDYVDSVVNNHITDEQAQAYIYFRILINKIDSIEKEKNPLRWNR